MYMRGRFSYIAGEWIILKPIYHAGQIISAYETVMGLPAAERLTGSDGTFKPEADQQRIDEVHKKALAAAELPMDWDGLTDRMRDCLLAKELAVGETVLFAATEPYGGPGDFALRGGVIQSIDPERGTCTIRGDFFPMDDVPLHYVLGSYDRSVSEEHYGFPHIRPLLGEHPELAERYLREAEARWNTQYGQSAATTEVPKNTWMPGHRQLHQRPRKTQCRRWEA